MQVLGFSPVQWVGLFIILGGLALMGWTVVRLQQVRRAGETPPRELTLRIAFGSMLTTLGVVLLLMGEA